LVSIPESRTQSEKLRSKSMLVLSLLRQKLGREEDVSKISICFHQIGKSPPP